jgi:hypothetical protein
VHHQRIWRMPYAHKNVEETHRNRQIGVGCHSERSLLSYSMVT